MSVFRRILDVLASPWRAWSQYRLERLRIITDAQNAPVREMASAMREQTKVLQTWLEGFKVAEVPTSSVVRDEDEVASERERGAKALNPAQITRMFEDLVDFDMPE
jgi:hypothetical protein